jgi:hypothetical protein
MEIHGTPDCESRCGATGEAVNEEEEENGFGRGQEETRETF